MSDSALIVTVVQLDDADEALGTLGLVIPLSDLAGGVTVVEWVQDTGDVQFNWLIEDVQLRIRGNEGEEEDDE